MATVSEEFLTKKVGPLPVYGWGGVFLGLAWLYSKYQAKATSSSSSSSSGSSADGAAEPASGAPYYVIENNLPGGGPNTGRTVAMPPGRGPAPPTTGSSTTTALPPPPSTGSSTGSSTSSTTSTTSTTPTAQTYTVQHGDTLWGIAQKFTGNGANDSKIWAYNTPAARKAAGLPPVQGTNPALIYPGEIFLIPPK